jgi:hypothetical protein
VSAGDDRAVTARRRGDMRASHADREGVIDTLKAAYVYGLVTKDEFDERVGQTLTSRTHAELAMITADIPAGLAAAPPLLSPALVKANPPAHANVRPGDGAVGATLVLAALAIVAAFFASGPLAALLALGATGSALVSLFLAAAQALNSRRDKRPGSQRPPDAAISTGRRTGQLPQISQPRRRSPADAARSRSLRAQLST